MIFLFKKIKKIINSIFERKQKIIIFERKEIPFRFIGTLFNKETNRVLQLYGRERYRRHWDYYILFNGKNFVQSKIFLEKLTRFLDNYEKVRIEIFDEEFILYKNDIHKYMYVPSYSV